jgi:hypothetical protein
VRCSQSLFWATVISTLLIGAVASHALDERRRYALIKIHEEFCDDYLTYQGALKAWYGNLLSKIGFKLSPDLEAFVKGRWRFEFAVERYASMCEWETLNMDLSPTQFKAVYNVQWNHLSETKAEKEKWLLDINKRYPPPQR